MTLEHPKVAKPNRKTDAPCACAILDAVGNTPLIELKRVVPDNGTRLLAKLEGNNPGGSVKDRPALWMIQEAERKGLLTQDKIILEPTSGNTGIGLALVGACKGYKVKLTLPACVSMERRQTLLAFGAELELTPHDERTDGAIRRAHQIVEEEPDRYFMPNQFANEANWRSHYETTGPEIMEQTQGDITAFVACLGTTGTIMGMVRYLKDQNPRIKVYAAEPAMGHTIQGLKNMQEAIVPAIWEPKLLDGIISVPDEPSFATTRRLALEEGLFVGMSSGAAVWAANQIAKDLPAGSTVVTILPDRGDRYLSTSLFRSVCAECPP